MVRGLVTLRVIYTGLAPAIYGLARCRDTNLPAFDRANDRALGVK